jgi:hypothetical protein
LYLSSDFLVPAAAILSAQLAVIALLHNLSQIRPSTLVSATSSHLGRFTRKLATSLLPVAVLVALVGDVAAVSSYRTEHIRQAEVEARAEAYRPIIDAALSAKPDNWCFPNGHLFVGDVSSNSKRPCAQVGQFRVMDQFLSISTALEIYKVFPDGSVKPAAYEESYRIGFKVDETVTSVSELKAAFGVK